MSIVPGSSLLASAVFLHFIGLICSGPRTLEDLFPGYKGVMPPVEEFWFEGQLDEFKTFGDKRLIFISTGLAKKSHIIFGGIAGNFIHDLYPMFAFLEPIFLIFDTHKAEWVTVPHDLTRKLGANRFLPLVVARDEVAARHVSTSNNPIYREAHIRACRQANEKVDIVEREQVQLLRGHPTNFTDIILRIEEEYSEAYDREFTRYLYQHGEYNLDGHREKHASKKH